METSLVVLLALLSFACLGLFIALLQSRRLSNTPVVSGESFLQMERALQDLRQDLANTSFQQRTEVTQRLDSISHHVTRSISEQGTKAENTVREVYDRLGRMDETHKQILGFSGQLQSLESILKNPKQRGILGEYWLETLLGQVLQPTQYQMQFQLGVDEDTKATLIPDAVIFVKDLLIPIDAKFSLENYTKAISEPDLKRREEYEKLFKNDVKNRIDETAKYIRPDLGTTQFAFMFIPAEGVYHNLLTTDVGAVRVNARNLIEYAFEKRVMIVSSTPFFAYLQTVLMGLNALRIEESVKVIQKRAEELMKHLKSYEEYHNKLGKHLETTARSYSFATKELKKVEKDVFRMSDDKTLPRLDLHEITESEGQDDMVENP